MVVELEVVGVGLIFVGGVVLGDGVVVVVLFEVDFGVGFY